jgi:hypothetical protein
MQWTGIDVDSAAASSNGGMTTGRYGSNLRPIATTGSMRVGEEEGNDIVDTNVIHVRRDVVLVWEGIRHRRYSGVLGNHSLRHLVQRRLWESKHLSRRTDAAWRGGHACTLALLSNAKISSVAVLTQLDTISPSKVDAMCVPMCIANNSGSRT